MDPTPDKKKVVTIDKARHRRVSVEAARKGVSKRDLVELMIDYTLPLIEGGKLEVSKPCIKTSSCSK